MKSISAFCILIAAVLTAAGTTHAQTSDSAIQALLDEVRQLRLAVERSAVMAPKIQMTLQRMQLQQDSVSRASRQLEDLHGLLAKSAAEEADLAFHIMDRRRLQLAEDVLGAALEIYVDYPEDPKVMARLRTAWEFGI